MTEATHPSCANATTSRRPSLPAPDGARRLFLWAAATGQVLLLLQSLALHDAVLSDLQLLELPLQLSLDQTFWLLRGVALLLAPVILGARVVAIATLLHLVTAPGASSRTWRALVRGVLRAELVLLLESACATVVLLWAQPTSLAAAEALQLRAGLDVFWQPASVGVADVVQAANVFAVWWGVRIFGTLRRATSRRRGICLLLSVVSTAVLVSFRVVAQQM